MREVDEKQEISLLWPYMPIAPFSSYLAVASTCEDYSNRNQQ